ncbi:MAG TPA: VOC family protein [Ilumatobacteraceae bacterium]|nr:VOC family protein [Ilumatobacteraceae bacterium]HRB02079.1 VOC family protein [Ilumatobacteraceae bacterium]
MSMHPYLFFTNTTRAAMTRYHEILGGHLEILGMDAMPPGEAEGMPFEAPEGFVMHAALKLDNGDLLLASDDPGGDGQGVKGMSINITLEDQVEARRIFEAFADGGEVGMALGETFWAPLFGTCTDRFGVNWMINVEAAGEV